MSSQVGQEGLGQLGQLVPLDILEQVDLWEQLVHLVQQVCLDPKD